jgi:nitrogenase molybdenum-cofactor synthesis protein NifE
VGEFNVAGDCGNQTIVGKDGVNIISTISGDSHADEIAQAHRQAQHSPVSEIIQLRCQKMEKKYGIPFIKVNFFGLEQTTNSLREIADFFGDEEMIDRTEKIIERELMGVEDETQETEKIRRKNRCPLCGR